MLGRTRVGLGCTTDLVHAEGAHTMDVVELPLDLVDTFRPVATTATTVLCAFSGHHLKHGLGLGLGLGLE